jgi:ABC-2 type transport system ATP-binding protein
MDLAIETTGLTRAYGRRRGITELDLEVRAGEVFGYLGPNGAGKTTTIRLLLDLIRPDTGTMRVLGMDPRRDGPALRRRIGYLPGELALYDSLSGRELTDYLAALRGGVPRARVDALAVRLDCDLSREIRGLSHGNKQKLGLIAAFMHDPELLILDEPTTGLDPLVQQTFMALVAEARAAGRTVFLSSHVLPEVERACDRVGIIRDGRLRRVATVAELTASAVRSVSFRFGDRLDPATLAVLPGVLSAEAEDGVVRCRVQGSVDALLKVAATHEVLEVTSEPPSLEDAFLGEFRDGPSIAPWEEVRHAPA